jgi:hypothetical protein
MGDRRRAVREHDRPALAVAASLWDAPRTHYKTLHQCASHSEAATGNNLNPETDRENCVFWDHHDAVADEVIVGI